jgi:hypothetical protein
MLRSPAGLVLALTLCLAASCGGVSPGLDAGAGAGDGGLDLNDVSFLLPLPPRGFDSQLPALRDGLLPHALYAQLPLLVEGADPAALEESLRVVSVRVDPCFPGATAGTCLKQVRLVAQPVHAGGEDAGFVTTTDDATVHLFYSLDDAAFTQVRAQLGTLKGLAGGATDHVPLGVHPVMQREGLDGPYARAVKALVAAHCTSATLTRVAFMQVAAFGSLWRFGAFNVDGGALVADVVPRLGTHTTQGVQDFGTPAFRSTQLLPTVSGDDLDVLLSESQLRLTDERTLTRGLTSALQIEHPQRSSPRTIDCASCHVASRARTNAERRRMVDTSSWADAFTASARFDLRRTDGAGDDPRALRSFGYFGPVSALSQRTINESAAVAAALSGP